jgi:4'-phosphopantetheinyl transferase EntD
LEHVHGCVVAVDVVDLDPGAWAELHPDEHAHSLTLAEVRRREWIAGRRALRHALLRVGDSTAIASHSIGSDERGAPAVPNGLVGSVSHKRALAVALAARDTGWTVGIDLELDEPRRIDIAHKVLTPMEMTRLEAIAGAKRDRWVTRAFAIKEAVYKAIDPHLRRYVGFQEVEVWPATDGSVAVAPVNGWGLEVEAAWLGDGVHWMCTARARRV